MNILFFDPCAYKPYTYNTLRSEALGGTEATVLRVARGLAKEGLDVSLFQLIDPHRDEATIDGIRHVHDSSELAPDVVVHLRTARFVNAMKETYPKARHLVWMHDLGGPHLKDEPLDGQELICVSNFHREQFLTAMPTGVKLSLPTVIYNPIEIDGLRYPKIEGRLGFFSSPHKGLDQVISAFKQVGSLGRELVIGNPGYMPDANNHGANITYLGQLPHCRVMEEMSKCQVLFYPQTTWPETFGLVLAEANAMGTPVLCHDFGAAKEVLQAEIGDNPGNWVVDCSNPEMVKTALERMLESPNPVRADPRFSLENVVADWKNLFGAP